MEWVLKLWIFQIERWHRRERVQTTREVWTSAETEETEIGRTAFEETEKERAWKSEQEKREDGEKSWKEKNQACKEEKNQSCFWE